MDEYTCTGYCEYCTLECATAGLPENESDFEYEDDDLEQKYWGCACYLRVLLRQFYVFSKESDNDQSMENGSLSTLQAFNRLVESRCTQNVDNR